MTPKEAQETIDASMLFLDRYYSIEKSLNKERERKKARLSHLKEELPELLASEILGESPNGKVEEVRREISDIEARLEYIPLVLMGLRSREHQHNVKHAAALNFLTMHDREKQFDEMKGQLEKKYDKVLGQQFRQLAADLGRSDEVRDWMDDLEQKWSRRPIKDH